MVGAGKYIFLLVHILLVVVGVVTTKTKIVRKYCELMIGRS
jgi:hypothetical protein